MSNPHLVFVYGSLKVGFGNNRILKDSRLISTNCYTYKRYLMYNFSAYPGLIRPKDLPQSISSTLTVHVAPVKGELYHVKSPDVLAALDRLEGYPNFYDKETIDTYGVFRDTQDKMIDFKRYHKVTIYHLSKEYLSRTPTISESNLIRPVEAKKSGRNSTSLKYLEWSK